MLESGGQRVLRAACSRRGIYPLLSTLALQYLIMLAKFHKRGGAEIWQKLHADWHRNKVAWLVVVEGWGSEGLLHASFPCFFSVLLTLVLRYASASQGLLLLHRA